MISPELLKRYPFFAGMTQSQLGEIAMLAQETTFEQEKILFEECDEANQLFLLLEGSIDLLYRSVEEYDPSSTPKQFLVGEINPGEVFGTSALIEPHEYNATARAARFCKVVIIDAVGIRKLLQQDLDLGNKLLIQVIKVLKERIIALRVQVATIQP
ncbi:MAG TPA: cyclic nucleotide-binding domain-containing protein [Anaerolineales bacterium]|nr:cyclic nucleotide-binding domain-containing protein [Anaerolineales bacterium]